MSNFAQKIKLKFYDYEKNIEINNTSINNNIYKL